MSDTRIQAAARDWACTGTDEGFALLQSQRRRAGLPLLCDWCREAEDARDDETYCECELPACARCHEGNMEHGHRHVHDPEEPVPCCRWCEREADERAREAEVAGGVCSACYYEGYSPSAAVMLSRGELECPACEGFNSPHNQGLCACEANDPSGHECDVACGECEGGVVACAHGGA